MGSSRTNRAVSSAPKASPERGADLSYIESAEPDRTCRAWRKYVARGEARVVVEQSGLPVAAIVSAEEYRRFKVQESRRVAPFDAVAWFSDAFAEVRRTLTKRSVVAQVAPGDESAMLHALEELATRTGVTVTRAAPFYRVVDGGRDLGDDAPPTRVRRGGTDE